MPFSACLHWIVWLQLPEITEAQLSTRGTPCTGNCLCDLIGTAGEMNYCEGVEDTAHSSPREHIEIIFPMFITGEMGLGTSHCSEQVKGDTFNSAIFCFILLPEHNDIWYQPTQIEGGSCKPFIFGWEPVAASNISLFLLCSISNLLTSTQT